MLSVIQQNESAAQRFAALHAKKRDDTVLVHEIYASVQGESTWAGVPCVFVRTTGCHLRCTYCDTAHAFHEGQELSLDDVVARVDGYGIPLVEVTGGEPLLQKSTGALLTRLVDAGRTVLVETSGAVSLDGFDRRARFIVDVKTPRSGESKRNVWKNVAALLPGHDELKFVLVDADDYAFAVKTLHEHPVPAGVTVLFSPATPGLDPAWLAESIVRDRLPVRFQLQMHKVLWGNKPGV